MAQNDSEYPVGYRKPPKEARFQKGTSGNPKGRPKGLLNLATVFRRTLRIKVLVNDGKRQKQVDLLEAVVVKMVTMAAQGNPPARRDLLVCMRELELDENRSDLSETLANEQQGIHNAMKRYLRMAPKDDKSVEKPKRISNVIE